MQGEHVERWRELCTQAAVEQDPVKLMQLIEEINQMLLEKKEERLQRRQTGGTQAERRLNPSRKYGNGNQGIVCEY
jgi:hypothetical protein